MVVILLWTAVTTFIVFYTLKRLDLLRVDKSIEVIGLDIAEMGGVPEDVYEKMRRDFGGSVYSRSNSIGPSPVKERDRTKTGKFKHSEQASDQSDED